MKKNAKSSCYREKWGWGKEEAFEHTWVQQLRPRPLISQPLACSVARPNPHSICCSWSFLPCTVHYALCDNQTFPPSNPIKREQMYHLYETSSKSKSTSAIVLLFGNSCFSRNYSWSRDCYKQCFQRLCHFAPPVIHTRLFQVTSWKGPIILHLAIFGKNS